MGYASKQRDNSSTTSATESPEINVDSEASSPFKHKNSANSENSLDSRTPLMGTFSEYAFDRKDSIWGEYELFQPEIINRLDKKENSKKGMMVRRTHYSSEVTKTLEWIGENHEIRDPGASLHITKLFKNLLEAFDKMEGDPMAHFFISLYDSLAFQDKWLEVPPNTFKQVCQLVKSLNNQQLTVEKVDKAILKLAKMELSVLPYFPDSDLEEEIWSKES